MRLAAAGLAFLTAFLASAVFAGPYAKAAAQVRANGGRLLLFVGSDLQSAAAAQLDATARALCHTIAAEGVAVTSVVITADSGAVIRLVNAATLAGC